MNSTAMKSPSGQQAGQPNSGPQAVGPQKRRIRKGELLFAESENSKAMYLLKSGVVRIFKKKGDAEIEIDTVHAGQIVGELAFLDGNPRSASAEALSECELIEISGPTFQAILANIPDWLKILLKTVVGRLRAASTRIRQIEAASTAYDYSDKDGKRTAQYTYLAPHEVLRICSAILLVGARNNSDPEIRVGLLQRYANQIMGVPVAKITSVLDILAQASIVTVDDDASGSKTYLKDIDFLEKMIAYLNEENLLEPAKRHDISHKGFIIMSCIAKNLGKYKADPTSEMTTVNLAEIQKLETEATGKEPFRMDEFPELVKLGYASNVTIKSAEAIFTHIKADSFIRSYKMQKVVKTIQVINEQKRKGGK